MDVGYIVRQLRAAGADAEITDDGIRLAGTPTHLEVMRRRPPTPWDLQRIVNECRSRSGAETVRPVISAERASSQAISWAHAHPEVTLVLDDRVILDGATRRLDDAEPVRPRRKGPAPYARFAIARVLLSGASRKDQVRLAELAGVSQGSVSNALRRIPEARDPGAAFDDLVRNYPGPGGQTYHWWSSRPVHEQASYITEQGALLSGDFAADRIAPWRMPERVVAYVDAPLDLSEVGYVLTDPGDYTMLVTVPADPTLRATARTWRASSVDVVDDVDTVADPIIVAWDVTRTATTGDDDEAVDRLRDIVVRRFTVAQDHG